MKKEELGIYVHIPFCVKKCFYCDFVSFANKQEMIKEYINALIKEIEYVGDSLIPAKNQEITTIYIGGGTPSFIDSAYIVDIINTIKSKFNIQKEAEITIEVNPRYCNKRKIRGLYKLWNK